MENQNRWPKKAQTPGDRTLSRKPGLCHGGLKVGRKNSVKTGQKPRKEMMKAGNRQMTGEGGRLLQRSRSKSQGPNQSSQDSGARNYLLTGEKL